MSVNKINVEAFIENFQTAWSNHDINSILSFFSDSLSFEDIPIGLHANNKEELEEILIPRRPSITHPRQGLPSPRPPVISPVRRRSSPTA